MVVAKAFLSRYTSCVAIASRSTLNSAHPSGFTTSQSCSLLSSRSHLFNGVWTSIALTLDLTGTVQTQLTLKTLASWLPAITLYKHGYSTSVLKDEFCYENMQLDSLLPRAWGNAKLTCSKSSYISSVSLTSIWLAILNEDVPLPFAFAWLLCV